jgi:glycerol-3-phosphate dehydrogenase
MRSSPHLRPLPGDEFDVVVAGGGINGVAIARQCASAGARVLLLEQHDFCSGTTSRSTRIIHGGLRYLEHGDLALVRESLRERERLLCQWPHLVRPLQFLLALPRNGAHRALTVRAGLWLYRRLGGARTQSSAASFRNLEEALDHSRRWALFSYDDAQCEFPERLVAEWLQDAVRAGAVTRNYTRLLDVTRSGGTVIGIRARDLLTGEEFAVACKWVINATGPWASRVASDCGIALDQPLIGGVRGSHIVVPRFNGAPLSAVYSEAQDGRPFFVVPWNGQFLVGTTEVRDDGDPATTQPGDGEIAYLLASLNALFPDAGLGHDDILYAFAGVRPLPYVPELAPSAITRREFLHDHASEGARGMLSVIGGKLTTAASLARQCARRIGLRAADPQPAMIALHPADGIESSLRQWSHQVAMVAGISAESARAMAEWHGGRALCIARLAGRDRRMRATLCPHTPHLVAEAVNAFEHEQAITAADVLLRRVPVGLNGTCDDDCMHTALERLGAAMGWGEERLDDETADFFAERDRFLVKPGPGARAYPRPVPDHRAA